MSKHQSNTVAPVDTPEVPTKVETTKMLSLTELAQRLGVSYAQLRRYAEAEGIVDWVGAHAVEGAFGVRYPPEAEGKFRELFQLANAKIITPKTAAAYLRGVRRETIPTSLEQLVDLSQVDKSGAEMFVSTLVRIADALEARPATVPDLPLLTREEAALLLRCTPSQVTRYVRAIKGRRGIFARADIVAYIEASRVSE